MLPRPPEHKLRNRGGRFGNPTLPRLTGRRASENLQDCSLILRRGRSQIFKICVFSSWTVGPGKDSQIKLARRFHLQCQAGRSLKQVPVPLRGAPGPRICLSLDTALGPSGPSGLVTRVNRSVIRRDGLRHRGRGRPRLRGTPGLGSRG